MKSFSFHRNERLRGRTQISELFGTNQSYFQYPFKLFYRGNTGEKDTRVLVSVPKKNFPRAVHRNLLKRRIREAYRTSGFRDDGKIYDLAIIYIGKEIVNYTTIRDNICSLLNRLR